MNILPITMPLLHIEKYMGTWHELAKMPLIWEKGCTNAIAEYELLPCGKITVKNTCLRDGKEVYSRSGKAFITKEHFYEPSKLSLIFNDGLPSDTQGGQSAPYWIHWTDYEHFSIVGGPSGEFLWILGRTPNITKYELDCLMIYVQQLGYDADKIKLNKGILKRE